MRVVLTKVSRDNEGLTQMRDVNALLLSTLGLRQAESEKSHARINKLTAELKATTREYEQVRLAY